MVEGWRRAYHATHPEFRDTMLSVLEAGPEGAQMFAEDTVRMWLGAIGLVQYADPLIALGFDSMEALSLLEAEDLDLLNTSEGGGGGGASAGPTAVILPGHKKKLIHAVSQLREAVETAGLAKMTLLAIEGRMGGGDDDEDGDGRTA